MATGRGYQSCSLKVRLPFPRGRHVSSPVTLRIATHSSLLHKDNKVHWAPISVRAWCRWGYLVPGHLTQTTQQIWLSAPAAGPAAGTPPSTVNSDGCQNSGPKAGAEGDSSWTELQLCMMLGTPAGNAVSLEGLLFDFIIHSFPIQGASISPSVYDRGMQNSHSFQAFFPKI